MTFNAAAVQAVFDAIVSQGKQLGDIERVYAHEPKSAPGTGLSLAIWWDSLDPYDRGSGMAAVSGRVTFMARFYRSFLGKDEDKIDPELLARTADFLAALSGAFTLLGTVRNTDLLGESGAALSVKAGYLEHDGKPYRVADLTLPVIINDMWAEAP